jgi:hypothetical protein
MKSLLPLLLLFPLLASGQSTQSGTVRGTVTDSTGASVPGAQVTIRNDTKLVARTATSGADGGYLFQYVPPGTYELIVAAPGFGTLAYRNLVLHSGDNLRQDSELKPSAVTTTLEVSAGAGPVVNTVNANINHTVGAGEFRDILLPKDDAIRIAAFLPGAIDEYRHNGRGDRQAVVVVDGENDGDENITGNTWKFHPPADAIAELRVSQDTYTAELGRTSGVRLEFVTKSGSNEFHGSASAYHRNEKFNANNWGSTTRSQSRLHNAGYTLGGPIRKERIFFFWSSYYRRSNDPSSGFRTWPTQAQIGGDFSAWASPRSGLKARPIKDPVSGQPFPGNVIPASRLNRDAVGYLNLYYPAVADPFALANNDYTTAPNVVRDDYYAPRLDFRVSDKLNLYWRFTYAHKEERPSWVATSKELHPDAIIRTGNALSSALAGTYLFSPSFLADFQAAFNRTNGPSTLRWPTSCAIGNIPGWSGKLLYPNANLMQSLPHVTLASGYTTVGRSVPFDNKWAQGSGLANFSIQRQTHSIKFGGEAVDRIRIQFSRDNTYGVFAFDGSATGDALADLLLGKAQNFTQSNSFRYYGMSAWQPALYLQDEIKASRKLTLTLGLRWESEAPYHSTKGEKFSNWLPSLYDSSRAHSINPQTGDITGTVNNLNGIQVVDVVAPRAKLNFAPRVGLALAPWGSKTAFRAGYGLFYDHLAHVLTQLSSNPPFQLVTTVYNAGFTDPSNGTPNMRPISLTAVELPFHVPSTHKYSAGVQRQLADMLVEVSYVGSFSTHQILAPPYDGPNVNQPVPNADVLARRVSIEAVRPYYGFGGINMRMFAGNGRYNSLQAQVRRTATKGLFLQAAYTLSRMTVDGGATDPRNRAYDRALSSEDVPQILSLAATYAPQVFARSAPLAKAVLHGWELSTELRFLSGRPLGVWMQTDTAGIGRTVRADWSGNVAQPREMGRWFDTAAFSAPAALTFGNSPNDSVRGPGSRAWDLGLFRNFAIKEKLRVQCRVEAYNVLNHFNLANPGTSFGTANFGKIVNKTGPRNMQMALRLTF